MVDRPPAPRRAAPPQRLGRSPWRFLDPSTADPDAGGVVGFGADLKPATLVDAYRRGIFPWPHPGVALPWFSPDPRALLPLDGMRVSRSLRRRLRRCGWETTVDAAFEAVVDACADRPGGEGTWIGWDMRQAYCALGRLGWAHSLEVWDGADLVGGLYGVAVGGCFTGESMFHRRADASKVALVDLVDRWREAGGAFIDVQLPTDHLASLGAVEVSRDDYLSRLGKVRDAHVPVVLDRLPVSRLAPV
ncbi:MAG: leucyl/phenylalanyl-tRNA--protein transferase [Acidimicrobiales bacterium]